MNELVEIYYINPRGRRVDLIISAHARQKFRERWNLLHPEDPVNGNVVQKIAGLFQQAHKYTPRTFIDKDRLKKHGTDTLYFRSHGFTFVVRNSTIVTIEISQKGERGLNKPSSDEVFAKLR